MPKSINDEFKDWWREEGRSQDNAYQGRAITAERAFEAGADVVIERLREGNSLKDESND